jgi:hypothetical protein
MRRALAAAYATVAIGCANHLVLRELPAAAEQPRGAIASPLVIDWIETRLDGFESDPSPDLIAEIVGALRGPGGFSEVYEPRRAYAAPAGGFHLSIVCDEALDRHEGRAAANVIAMLFSSGLAGLFLPFYLDDRVELRGALLAPNGETHAFSSAAAGTMRSYALIGLTHAETDLRRHILGETLRSFSGAIAADSSLATPSREVTP